MTPGVRAESGDGAADRCSCVALTVVGSCAMEPHLGTGWRISALGDALSARGTTLLSCEAGREANFGAVGTGERAMGEKHLTEATGLRMDRRD